MIIFDSDGGTDDRDDNDDHDDNDDNDDAADDDGPNTHYEMVLISRYQAAGGTFVFEAGLARRSSFPG